MLNPQSAELFASFQASLNQHPSEMVLAVGKQVFGEIFTDFQRVLNEHRQLNRDLVFAIVKQVIDHHYATPSGVTVDDVVSDRHDQVVSRGQVGSVGSEPYRQRRPTTVQRSSL